MVQIQRAVERIDAGTYGFCESCGKPIPKARLKAFPMATLDVALQAARGAPLTAGRSPRPAAMMDG